MQAFAGAVQGSYQASYMGVKQGKAESKMEGQRVMRRHATAAGAGPREESGELRFDFIWFGTDWERTKGGVEELELHVDFLIYD